ncbi:MAG: heparinase II/III family protein [Erythrobacter sp.]
MESLFDDTDTHRDVADRQDADPGADHLGGESGSVEARKRPALALSQREEPLVLDREDAERVEPFESTRALALADVIVPRSRPGEALIRLAYRMGVPGHALSAPFRRPVPRRMLATVESPNGGDRAAGIALRAGHFCVHGVKQPITQIDFDSSARLGPGLERAIHSFSWLADLAASAPRAECVPVAERITRSWLDVNPVPSKGPAWDLEHASLRLLAWLVHAPLVLGGSDRALRARLLEAVDDTADWVEGRAARHGPGFAQVAAWAAVTAAGLLLPQGRPRRLCAEAALIRAIGDMVAEDGGTLSRCPAAQLEAIRLLTDLIACYEAVEIEPPRALGVMRELLVPPLLALRHGDGAIGNWQGQGAISARRLDTVIGATGIRTRPLNEPEHWGFQRIRSGKTIVQMDAGPPPRARHTRCGAASTLAFELSDGPARIIVNCGGAATAGGQVPARIGQGLRATAAHSTLVLDNANSTAVLLHGKLGRGVETVEVERSTIEQAKGRSGTRIEASHDGYGARFGLKHTRILSLGGDGTELAGEDVLIPASRRGRRGKIGFAIRFHLGRGVEAHLTEDRRGASLLAPDGRLWQFRLAAFVEGAEETELACEDSLWVDGEGRPHMTEQLVIEGLTSRGGGRFAWLLKKMG